MNLANWLSVLRILFIPLNLILLSVPGLITHQLIWAFIVFLLLIFTDYLDGFIARKLSQVTNLGKFLDPLADKLLVISLLLFFVQEHRLGYVWVALIVFREFSVQGLRTMAALRQIVIKADYFGKIKTVWQFITLGWLILSLPYALFLIQIMVILTLLSGLNYFWVNRGVLSNE